VGTVKTWEDFGDFSQEKNLRQTRDYEPTDLELLCFF
jgi:hypothetical protein